MAMKSPTNTKTYAPGASIYLGEQEEKETRLGKLRAIADMYKLGGLSGLVRAIADGRLLVSPNPYYQGQEPVTQSVEDKD